MCDICKDRLKLKEYLVNASSVTPKQDDLIREQFESNITHAGRAKNSKGKYINSLIEAQWKGFQWAYEIVLRKEKIIKELLEDAKEVR